MTRRAALLLPAGLCAARVWAADAADAAMELLGLLASRLSQGDAAGAMDAFDSSMPGYEEFRANLAGLLAQMEAQSSLDILRNEGTDTERTVEIDWLLQLKERHDTGAVVRRRETVTCRIEKRGRKWKIFSLSPQSFFTPVQMSK